MRRFSIIFDLDGTLWDSTKTISKAWEKVILEECSEFNITQDKIKKVMGLTTDEIAIALLSNLDTDARKRILDKCFLEENNMIRKTGAILYDDVLDEIKRLSITYDLYIVSNCQAGYIESFLEYYHLEKYFKDIECYGNNNYSKAENIKLIIKRNKIDKCCYVGDTINDYNSAIEANVPFIFASYGFGNVNNYSIKIDNFKQLKDIIKKIK